MDEKKKPKKPANPHANHRDRMRKRYLKTGLDSMANHEILEILLFYAIPRKDTNKLAHKIMQEYGSLHNLFEAPATDIAKRCGLSINTAVLLSMIAPLARIYNLSKWQGRVFFNSTKALSEYVMSLFIGEVNECFYMLCLDNDMNLISTELLEKGTVDNVQLYPREIVRRVLYSNACYIVLSHNHPSGSEEVSVSDIQATRTIREIMKGVEVAVLDHMIICGQKYVSFAEKRLLGLVGIEAALELEEN